MSELDESVMGGARRSIGRFWRKLPLPDWVKDHLLAISQLLIILLMSNAPVISSAITKTAATDHAEFFPTLLGTLHGGEVYIYAAALIAPFWWTLIEAHRINKKIKFVWIPIILAMAATTVGCIFYTQLSLNTLRNEDFVRNWAVALFFASLAVWYWSIYSDRRLSVQDPFRLQRSEVDDLMEQIMRGRHGQD